MPGGQLTFGIYTLLGGEREFSTFWLHLGLPGFAIIGVSFYFLAGTYISIRYWVLANLAFVAALAAAVNVRAIH